jgi:glycosyltransferase involved in cell wall biosynthesis
MIYPLQHYDQSGRFIDFARNHMSITSPLISIVIPTWNRPVLVSKLVEWINAKDTCGDIEIVIVDNHSTEENWSQLQKITSMGKYVKIYRNSQNIGMTPNWNKAIKNATGQWIGFMCDDDIFRSDSIRRIRGFIGMAQNPCLILQNSTIHDEYEWIQPGVTAAKRVALPPASGQFWHRTITEKLGGFDERVKYCPDAEFWLRLAYHYPVLLVRDYFVIPCQHNTNYMWEAFRSQDFLEQVSISARLSSQWLLGREVSDQELVQSQIDDGIWETLRTVLNNTFLKPAHMNNFSYYFCEFVRYSFLLKRKKLMVKTVAKLPLLRAKELARLALGITNSGVRNQIGNSGDKQ